MVSCGARAIVRAVVTGNRSIIPNKQRTTHGKSFKPSLNMKAHGAPKKSFHGPELDMYSRNLKESRSNPMARLISIEYEPVELCCQNCDRKQKKTRYFAWRGNVWYYSKLCCQVMLHEYIRLLLKR